MSVVSMAARAAKKTKDGKLPKKRHFVGFGTKLKIILLALLLITVIIVIVIINADSPDYINMAAYRYRTYSTQNLIMTVNTEKERRGIEDANKEEANRQINEMGDVTLGEIPENRQVVESARFQENYVAFSNKLYAYVSTEGGFPKQTVSVNGNDFDVDALLFLAMCNAETTWQGDLSKVASVAYPWRLCNTAGIDADNCEKYFALCSMYHVYSNKANYMSASNHLYTLGKVWADPTNNYTIGALSFWFYAGDNTIWTKKQWPNERDQLDKIGRETILGYLNEDSPGGYKGSFAKEATPNETIVEQMFDRCTGGEQNTYAGMKYPTPNAQYGDRYNILNCACAYSERVKENCSMYLSKKCPAFATGKKPSFMTFLAYMRYCHWGPGACQTGGSYDKVANLWSGIATALGDEKAYPILLKYADNLLTSMQSGNATTNASACVKELEAAGVFDSIDKSERPSSFANVSLNGESAFYSIRAYEEPVGFITHYLALNELYSGKPVN